MPSHSELTDNETPRSPLPPVISYNLRVKLEAQQISLSHLILHKERRFEERIVYEEKKRNPNYPLHITWHPTKLYLDIKDTVIVQKLSVCNASSRLVYIKCGQFSNDSGRLGAGWRCLQRNRFLLAPGIMADIFIKVTPRDFAPISSADVTLQLVAGHMRDIGVAIYEIPIFAKFLKYVPPPLREDG